MAGSVVSSKPEQRALRTAALPSLPETRNKEFQRCIYINNVALIPNLLMYLWTDNNVGSNFIPLYCLLFITRVGSIVTSPREPLPIWIQNCNIMNIYATAILTKPEYRGTKSKRKQWLVMTYKPVLLVRFWERGFLHLH